MIMVGWMHGVEDGWEGMILIPELGLSLMLLEGSLEEGCLQLSVDVCSPGVFVEGGFSSSEHLMGL